MKLIQIPFSHNCVKVRRGLELKGLPFEVQNIAPLDRGPVRRASGQPLVPALIHDDGTAVADSTAILLDLEARFSGARPLLPADPALRAECLVLEDWADAAFMARSRRMAYARVLATPGALGNLFFPGRSAPARAAGSLLARRLLVKRFGISPARDRHDRLEARRQARLALDRLGGRDFLVGGSLSLADLALATMTGPLWGTDAAGDREVAELLAWGRPILGEEARASYLS